MAHHRTATLSMRSPRYYGHFILARWKPDKRGSTAPVVTQFRTIRDLLTVVKISPEESSGRFLFRFLRNETVLFSVQG